MTIIQENEQRRRESVIKRLGRSKGLFGRDPKDSAVKTRSYKIKNRSFELFVFDENYFKFLIGQINGIDRLIVALAVQSLYRLIMFKTPKTDNFHIGRISRIFNLIIGILERKARNNIAQEIFGIGMMLLVDKTLHKIPHNNAIFGLIGHFWFEMQNLKFPVGVISKTNDFSIQIYLSISERLLESNLLNISQINCVIQTCCDVLNNTPTEHSQPEHDENTLCYSLRFLRKTLIANPKLSTKNNLFSLIIDAKSFKNKTSISYTNAVYLNCVLLYSTCSKDSIIKFDDFIKDRFGLNINNESFIKEFIKRMSVDDKLMVESLNSLSKLFNLGVEVMDPEEILGILVSEMGEDILIEFLMEQELFLEFVLRAVKIRAKSVLKGDKPFWRRLRNNLEKVKMSFPYDITLLLKKID